MYDVPDFVVGETYMLWDEVELIVISETHMVIFAPFGVIDVTLNEISGLWVS